MLREKVSAWRFPFLFGGAFIEGRLGESVTETSENFPSFSEGLSLRATLLRECVELSSHFPSFSEGLSLRVLSGHGH